MKPQKILTNGILRISLLTTLLITACHKPQIETLQTLPEWTPTRWMENLPDRLSLAELSIPGTHESCARYGANFDTPRPTSGINASEFWKCQNADLSEQLKMGIRYLDIRCRRVGSLFKIYHGPIYQRMNFQDVIDICETFLRENPSETIILKTQEEQTDYMIQEGTDTFSNIFDFYTKRHNLLFYQMPTSGKTIIPTLGDVRGKIVLLNRFKHSTGSAAAGIHIDFADNTTSNHQLSVSEQLRVQDVYKVKDAKEKLNPFLAMLEESNSEQRKGSKLYINHASAYQPYATPILGESRLAPYYAEVSKFMGNSILNTLQTKTKAHTGIIAMDFVTASHCDVIIKSNAFIGRKQQ